MVSVRSGVDLDFRTSTDGQDQVLKSRSLDGRGGGRRMTAATITLIGTEYSDPHGEVH
jgi:hypothetical protein